MVAVGASAPLICDRFVPSMSEKYTLYWVTCSRRTLHCEYGNFFSEVLATSSPLAAKMGGKEERTSVALFPDSSGDYTWRSLTNLGPVSASPRFCGSVQEAMPPNSRASRSRSVKVVPAWPAWPLPGLNQPRSFRLCALVPVVCGASDVFVRAPVPFSCRIVYLCSCACFSLGFARLLVESSVCFAAFFLTIMFFSFVRGVAGREVVRMKVMKTRMQRQGAMGISTSRVSSDPEPVDTRKFHGRRS